MKVKRPSRLVGDQRTSRIFTQGDRRILSPWNKRCWYGLSLQKRDSSPITSSFVLFFSCAFSIAKKKKIQCTLRAIRYRGHVIRIRYTFVLLGRRRTAINHCDRLTALFFFFSMWEGGPPCDWNYTKNWDQSHDHICEPLGGGGEVTHVNGTLLRCTRVVVSMPDGYVPCCFAWRGERERAKFRAKRKLLKQKQRCFLSLAKSQQWKHCCTGNSNLWKFYEKFVRSLAGRSAVKILAA